METRKKPAAGPAVGSELEALCGKCKKATRHVVLAMLAGKPSRVECRPCGATHAYRPPKDAADAAPAAKKASTRSATGGAKKGAKAAAPAGPSPAEVWAAAMRKAAASTPVKYSMSGRFDPGQRLTHATFGEGVVQSVQSASVCAVVFSDGIKKLLMGR